MILDKPIIAIDFDGTLTKGDNRVWLNDTYSNDIIEPNYTVIEFIKKYRQEIYLILWTCRYDEGLETAINWCKQFNIEFDRVNENVVPYETSNKIMADYYLDDKNILIKEVLEWKM